MHRLLKSLRISEEQVLKETQVPESLSEIEYRQGHLEGCSMLVMMCSNSL